jgi:hypothetical protein
MEQVSNMKYTNPLMNDPEARAYAYRQKGGNQHAFPLQLVGDYACARNAAGMKQIQYVYR